MSASRSVGESLGTWGPNGAGKTTIMRCLLGIARYEGEVRIGGFNPAKQGREARGPVIGFVPQELPVSPMSVSELGRFIATLKGCPAGAEDEPIALLGLGDQGDKAVGALSGGMRQRLALALALIGTPKVLLLDEPTANLDAQGRAELLDLLRRLKAQGMTMVFSSHRPEDVISMADRVLMIEGGKVQTFLPAAEFRREHESGTRLVITLSNGHLHEALTALERVGVPAEAPGMSWPSMCMRIARPR